jgi:hypothetical protein
MAKIIFAMLAHAQPDVVTDSIASFLREPGSECVLFDGGLHQTISHQLDVEICPFSAPIRYAHTLFKFHSGVLRYLYETGRDYEFLVFVEGDMSLLKPGFYKSLCRTMANSEYMATNFHEIFDSPERACADWHIGATFLRKWKDWKDHFPGVIYPYGCLNPGQTVRKEFVDRLFQKNVLSEILAHAERSPLPTLEEVVWPTLAANYAVNPITNPGSHGIRIGSFSSAEMKRFVQDPSVFLLHKMSMRVAAPDREFVRSIWGGGSIDSLSFYPAKDARSWPARKTTAWIARTKLDIKSIYYRMADG